MNGYTELLLAESRTICITYQASTSDADAILVRPANARHLSMDAPRIAFPNCRLRSHSTAPNARTVCLSECVEHLRFSRIKFDRLKQPLASQDVTFLDLKMPEVVFRFKFRHTAAKHDSAFSFASRQHTQRESTNSATTAVHNATNSEHLSRPDGTHNGISWVWLATLAQSRPLNLICTNGGVCVRMRDVSSMVFATSRLGQASLHSSYQ